MIEGISAVTLGTHEMPRAVRFYCALGFEVLRGNEQSSFTSLRGEVMRRCTLIGSAPFLIEKSGRTNKSKSISGCAMIS